MSTSWNHRARQGVDQMQHLELEEEWQHSDLGGNHERDQQQPEHPVAALEAPNYLATKPVELEELKSNLRRLIAIKDSGQKAGH